MEEPEVKSEALLRLWAAKIHKLEAKTLEAGSRARFEDLVCLDELKALQAIAQSKFDDLRTAGDSERADLQVEMRRAWSELEAAFKHRRP